ncbi:cyclic nucleotide-binding domain-containing protein [Anabaena sp. PCC 7108]|uniref:cyclic nucleotide-binding domain-containing protein n=1 Tax=Anabaena sp. PCC 7108 TaxID=163908 RepID=UPI00034D7178|nr:cyclic nucleotide-binding domain-containing protein [Anabaena sp. PCC 7108]
MTLQQSLLSFSHFDVLQEQDHTWLMSIAQIQSYPVGTSLIQAGQQNHSLYLVLKGSPVIQLPDFDGKGEDLIPLAVGAFIGETALLDDHPPSFTVKANEPVEVLKISKQALANQLKSDRSFAARFYQLLAIKLSERLRQLSTLMAKRQIKEGEPLRKVLMVFATLNDSDVAWLLANGAAEKAPLGTALIQQGKAVPAIYLLLDGILGIYISTSDGGTTQEIEVAKRVKGDILGEMSFVDGGSASATVRALENAWFLAIPQPMLAEKMKTDQGFSSRFYQAIAQIMTTRCQNLLVQSRANLTSESVDMLSADIEVEDELDLDILEGTAIAGKRFDWMIQQLHR